MSTKAEDNGTEGLRVIGGGLMRTGTMSLKLALERLLDGKCYHMASVFENPGHIDFWRAAASKDPTDEEWRSFLSNYKAAVDFPPVAFYKRLMRVYPDAKVVLSVRDPRKWFRSFNSTIAQAFIAFNGFPLNLLNNFSNRGKFPTMAKTLFDLLLGPNLDLNNEETMVAVFEKHVAEVKRVVPEDRLLVFEASEGWERLCNFLGVDVPQEPYPHVNTTNDFQSRLRWMTISAIGGVTVVSLIIGGLGFSLYRILKNGKLPFGLFSNTEIGREL